jgi:hypothetical protein
MVKYSGDCNGDGVINCEDYMHIHKYGYGGCQALTKPTVEVTPAPDIDIRFAFPE